jgi:non-reducing end alpha-L-arabinofuranosidase
MRNGNRRNRISRIPLSLVLATVVPSAGLAATGPCDIYKAANVPCVAAYSTVRALFDAYDGALYQVRRGSDNTKKDIGLLSAGGIVDASIQDDFCKNVACRISIIYDQSGKGNHLTKAPKGSEIYGLYNDSEAVADALPIKIAGQKAYGVHITPGGWTTPGQVGYRNTSTNGVVKGDNPETEYMIADGTYVNGACCFDFGNAEMSSTVYGDMETIYFGTNDWWDKGVGSGPWVMADLENGVYNMGGAGNYATSKVPNGNKINSNSISFPHAFVTAYLKGNSATATNGGPFTLKGGNAQTGKLTTVWDGAFPIGYSPRSRQGGIVLGVGGDNSSGARGNFYEGVMTAGFASDAIDDAIQANIVAAGYGSSVSSVRTVGGRAPSAVRMDHSRLQVEFEASPGEAVSVGVFDLKGNQVRSGAFRAGNGAVQSWTSDLSGIPAGVYAVRVVAGGDAIQPSKFMYGN